MTIKELKNKKKSLLVRSKEMLTTAKKELRELTPEEEEEFDANLKEIENLKEEIEKLEENKEQLKEKDEKIAELEARLAEEETEEKPEEEEKSDDEKPEDEEVEEKSDEEKPEEEEEQKEEEKPEEEKPEDEINKEENKRNININMSKNLLVKQIRNAMNSADKKITVSAETRTVKVTGNDGIHDNVVEEEFQGILEPLYAKSVLADLGVRFYTGVPKGDYNFPVMGKGTVGWAGEVAAAGASGNTFSNIKMSPKRLTAYIDISKLLLLQDTIGVENAIRRDLSNAIADKLQETILSGLAKTDEHPAGILNGKTGTAVSTFAGLTALEASVENNNVFGEMKYLVKPSAKAALRAMAKSSKNTQLVMEGGEIDGTPVICTSNLDVVEISNNTTTGINAVYGDFSAISVASWGDIEITVDEYTQAVNGCVRLIVNAYFDAAITRPEALAYATIS